ncbi:hypothetical protein Tco_0549078, partial [Tanacetum coccineum]
MPVALTNGTSATLNHTKSIMILLQEQFLQRQKEARKKLIQIQSLNRSLLLPQKKRRLEKENKRLQNKQDGATTTQDDEDDDDHDDDEKVQDD